MSVGVCLSLDGSKEGGVREFYDKHYRRFAETRYTVWDVMKDFEVSMGRGSRVLEAGCGNGKNLVYLRGMGHYVEGIDFSKRLVVYSRARGINVCLGDIRSMPYMDNEFDYVISVAVIHHISTYEGRVMAIREMYRVLRPGGRMLVTVWAVEQDERSRRDVVLGDNMIPFEGGDRYYYIFNRELLEDHFIGYDIERVFWDKSNWNIIVRKV